MNKFDLIKILFPREYVHKLNMSLFQYENLTDFSGELIKDNKVLRSNKILGLNSIIIDEISNKVTMEFTAKILQEHYPHLIDINTLPIVFEKLKQQNIIELDYPKVLESAEVLKLHVTRDLKLKLSSKEYFRDIQLYSSRENFRINTYSVYGLEVSGVSKSNKNRMIFYDKYLDISRPIISNQELLKYFSKDVFKGVFRVEGNLTSFATIRNFFDISENEKIYLKDIVSRPTNVLLNYFNYLFPEIKCKAPIAPSFKSGMSLNSVEKQIARRAIIEQCNYDLNTIKSFLKSFVDGNPSYYMKEYKKLLVEMKFEKSDSDFKTIEEIRTKF